MATAESIRELLDKMAAEREALLREAEALTDESAGRTQPDAAGEAQWSAKEQLAHLAEMETTYRAWVERALAEDGADRAGRARARGPASAWRTRSATASGSWPISFGGSVT